MVLADDVLWSVRLRRQTALVAAALHGAVGLFTSRHVVAEVERLLPKRAADQGLSPSDALGRWRQSHLPVLHVVDVPDDWGAEDPRVHKTAQQDATDAPTARLTVALAPAFGLSRDRSLTLSDLAEPDWLPLALAAADRAAYHQGLDGVTAAVGAVTLLVRAAMGAGAKLPVPAQLLIAAALVALFRPSGGTRSARTSVRRAGCLLLMTIATIEELNRSWDTKAVHAVRVNPDRRPVEALASELAARGAMTAEDVATELGWPPATVRVLLAGCSAFTESEGGWTLGRLGEPVDDATGEATMVLVHRAMRVVEQVRTTIHGPAGGAVGLSLNCDQPG